MLQLLFRRCNSNYRFCLTKMSSRFNDKLQTFQCLASIEACTLREHEDSQVAERGAATFALSSSRHHTVNSNSCDGSGDGCGGPALICSVASSGHRYGIAASHRGRHLPRCVRAGTDRAFVIENDVFVDQRPSLIL